MKTEEEMKERIEEIDEAISRAAELQCQYPFSTAISDSIERLWEEKHELMSELGLEEE